MVPGKRESIYTQMARLKFDFMTPAGANLKLSCVDLIEDDV